MRTSEVFKEARNRMLLNPDAGYVYICHVLLFDLRIPKEHTERARMVIFERIMGRTPKNKADSLYGCDSLEQWLQKNGVPSKEITPKKMQAYRQRWLTALVEEFEAKGD